MAVTKGKALYMVWLDFSYFVSGDILDVLIFSASYTAGLSFWIIAYIASRTPALLSDCMSQTVYKH